MPDSRMREVARKLPRPIKDSILNAGYAADPAIRHAYARRHPASGAVPPGAVRARVGGPGIGFGSITAYLRGGRATADDLAAAIASTGRNLDDCKSVLDFGCGSGRVLRYLAGDHPGFTGCDVDREAIEWAQEHLPGISWVASPFTPPLPFETNQFDLIVSVSVLSHLEDDLALSWVQEIARVLTPGGLALLSTHGNHAWEQFRSGAVSSGIVRRPDIDAHGNLDDEGQIFLPFYDADSATPGTDSRFGNAFQSEAHIRGSWGKHLDIVEVLPRGMNGWQDLVLATVA